MNKYLEKIAKSKSNNPDGIEGLAAGALATGSAAVASTISSLPLISTLDSRPGIDRSTLRKVLKANKDLNVTFSAHKAVGNSTGGHILKDSLSRSGPAFVNDGTRHTLHKVYSLLGKFGLTSKEDADSLSSKLKKNYVHMGHFGENRRVKNLDIALHELGHARDMGTGSKFVQALKTKSYTGSALAHRTGIGALVGGAMLTNDKTKDYAWTAPVISAAPMLRGEAAANYQGYKMLKPHATPLMKRKFLGIAAKNMASYGSGAVASGLALHLANSYFKKDK